MGPISATDFDLLKHLAGYCPWTQSRNYTGHLEYLDLYDAQIVEDDDYSLIGKLGDYLMKDGWWGYLYLQSDNEMVNYGGLDLGKHETQFTYNMTADGHITPSSHIQNMPKVTNMLYDSGKDVITADVIYKEQS